VLHPLAVYGLAFALGLPPIETAAVVMLAGAADRRNVYLMSRRIRRADGPSRRHVLTTVHCGGDDSASC